MPTIKINRALAVSGVGRFPGSADAMLERIPAAVIKALPSRLLAEMLDAMWAACQEAKTTAARDAVAEGAVWDARVQRFRDLAA